MKINSALQHVGCSEPTHHHFSSHIKTEKKRCSFSWEQMQRHPETPYPTFKLLFWFKGTLWIFLVGRLVSTIIERFHSHVFSTNYLRSNPCLETELRIPVCLNYDQIFKLHFKNIREREQVALFYVKWSFLVCWWTDCFRPFSSLR